MYRIRESYNTAGRPFSYIPQTGADVYEGTEL